MPDIRAPDEYDEVLTGEVQQLKAAIIEMLKTVKDEGSGLFFQENSLSDHTAVYARIRSGNGQQFAGM